WGRAIIKHPTIKLQRCQKLLQIYKGPFVVVEQLSANTYYVKDANDQLLKVPRDQIMPSSIESNLSKIHKRGRPRREV
ncbi:hypothetical protein BLA29_011577, partial [Euroglyphus maynei]